MANADAMIKKADKIHFKSETKASVSAISHEDSDIEKIIDNKFEKFFDKFLEAFNNNNNNSHREKFVNS